MCYRNSITIAGRRNKAIFTSLPECRMSYSWPSVMRYICWCKSKWMDWVRLFCTLFHDSNDKKRHDDNECNATLWQYWVFFFSFVSRPTSIELPRPHLPPFSQGFICSFQFLTWCCYYCYVWYAVACICSIAAQIFDMLLLWCLIFTLTLICWYYFDVWCCCYVFHI